MVSGMEKELQLFQKELNIQAPTKMVNSMDMVGMNFKMEMSMKETLKMDSQKVKDLINGKTVENMKVCTRMVKGMGKVYLKATKLYMMESGNMTRCMVKVNTLECKVVLNL